jgi:hypothetical protein
MRISITDFSGEIPRRDPQLLAPSQARRALNCKLDSGALSPWREHAEVQRPSKQGVTRTLHLLENRYWLHWPRRVDCCRLPVASSIQGQTVISGLDQPRLTDLDLAGDGSGESYPLRTRLLGVPGPSVPPQAATGSGGALGDDGGLRSLSYVHTFVNQWGEEGPPSPPSPVLEARHGQTVDIFNLEHPSDDWWIAKRRVYRTLTPSSGSAMWRFCAEIPVAQYSFSDTVPDDELGEEMSTASHVAPPATLRGIIALPGGFLAGFSNNELRFSEPYRPWAWPMEYALHTDHSIVALGSFGATLVAATNAHPYMASGNHPSAMSLSRLPDRQACVAPGGMVSLNDGVLFPSPDGLYFIGSKGGRLATGQLMDRDAWQALNPESMNASVHNRRVFSFYTHKQEPTPKPPPDLSPDALVNGFHIGNSLLGTSPTDGMPWTEVFPEGGGLVFDFADENPMLTFLDFYAAATYAAPETDTLYCNLPDTQGKSRICAWEKGTEPLTATWRSKTFNLPRPATFGAARIDSDFDHGPMTLRIFADNVLRLETQLDHTNPVRLPAGFRAARWEIELQGSSRVTQVAMATTIDDLEQET